MLREVRKKFQSGYFCWIPLVQRAKFKYSLQQSGSISMDSSSSEESSLAFQVPWVWAHIPREFKLLFQEIQTTGMVLGRSPVSVFWISSSHHFQKCGWLAAGGNGLRIPDPSPFCVHGKVTVESQGWAGMTVMSPNPSAQKTIIWSELEMEKRYSTGTFNKHGAGAKWLSLRPGSTSQDLGVSHFTAPGNGLFICTSEAHTICSWLSLFPFKHHLILKNKCLKNKCPFCNGAEAQKARIQLMTFYVSSYVST